MRWRLLLVLLSFFCLNSAVFTHYSQINGSILGTIVSQAPTVTISASITGTDTEPPLINYISPTDLQQNVPASAAIQVEISDTFSGVDINTVQIIINGTVYLASNPNVTVTGDPSLYNIVVQPVDPLYTDQTDTVTTAASDLAGNHSESTITFNVPAIPTPTPTPGPTSTPTPSPTGEPTSTPSPGPTSTPRPSPTPTPIFKVTPTLTARGTPTVGPSPTILPLCRNPITCPVCPIVTPAPIISTTGPDLSPPDIAFIQPNALNPIDLTPSATIKISDSGSGVNLNSVKISLNHITLTSADPVFSITGDSASYTITVKFNQSLAPNTNYFLIAYASDFAGNRLTKTVNLKTKNPLVNQVATLFNQTSTAFSFPSFPRSFNFFVSLLLLLLILGTITYFIHFLHSLHLKDSRPLGLVYNSLTHEPLSDIKVQIFNSDHHLVTSVSSNIFGIIPAKLPPGRYRLLVNHPDFAFPAKAHLNRLNYPEPYLGEMFTVVNTDSTYLYLPLDPYKAKTLSYRLRQRFSPHPGLITDSTGDPQVGVELGLKETKFNSLVTSRISDSLGHYRFIVPPGHYQLVLLGTDTILDTIDTRHLVTNYTVINHNLVI